VIFLILKDYSKIENIYKEDTTEHNKPVFLHALKYEYKKDALLAERTKEIAYEIVADLAAEDPQIVVELKNFNADKSLIKDVVRYKTKHN